MQERVEGMCVRCGHTTPIDPNRETYCLKCVGPDWRVAEVVPLTTQEPVSLFGEPRFGLPASGAEG